MHSLAVMGYGSVGVAQWVSIRWHYSIYSLPMNSIVDWNELPAAVIAKTSHEYCLVT